VPLETSRLCAEALERTRDVAAAGARVATSDIFVAVGLLKAAADGAASNVRANIEGLADEAFVRETTRQLTSTLDAVARAAHASMAALQD
jgi:formiminotetrahydrofolate cyclodeaminase